MDDLLSEKEQLEALRAWWNENGRYIIGGVVLGVALLVGWNQWQSRTTQAQLQASAVFETVLSGVADGDLETARTAASDLYDNYDETIYSPQARLAMARLYMDKGRDEDAAGELRALVASDAPPEIGLLGKLRLAKVLLYQNKGQEVVELLGDEAGSAYTARFSEALGDAYVLLGQFEEAADAYTIAAADDPDVPTVDRTLVQMKINDLPEPGKVAAVDETLEAEAAAGEGENGSEQDSEQDSPAEEAQQ